MKKRISFLLMSVLLLCAMTLPAGAVQQTYETTEIIETELGSIEKTSVITVRDSLVRSNSKSADCADTYRYGGKVIAEVTLSATFGYDGKTAWVISASGSHTTYDGWSYSGEKITKSGGSATLTAKLSKWSEGTANVNISLKCSPSGQIS